MALRHYVIYESREGCLYGGVQNRSNTIPSALASLWSLDPSPQQLHVPATSLYEHTQQPTPTYRQRCEPNPQPSV